MSNSNHVQHKSMEMKLNSLLTNKFNSLGDKLTNFAIFFRGNKGFTTGSLAYNFRCREARCFSISILTLIFACPATKISALFVRSKRLFPPALISYGYSFCIVIFERRKLRKSVMNNLQIRFKNSTTRTENISEMPIFLLYPKRLITFN